MRRQLLDRPWKPTPPSRLAELLAATAAHTSSSTRRTAFTPGTAARPLRRKDTRTGIDPNGSGDTPPLEALVFSRAAFGPTPNDVDVFRGMGATPRQRLEAWVDWQLDPASIADGELEVRLAESGFQTLDKDLTELWTDHALEVGDFDERLRPIYETQHATVLKAIYSRRQLGEVLADFWHNHFNVLGFHFFAGPVFVHWDRDVIRAHSLGNFRRFLEAMSTAPAMLFYLDNVVSSADGPNENFARELLELHTLGEANYLGASPASDVPTFDNGVPIGFTDEDVRELARCLTGWSLHEESGQFLYRWYWHDTGPKKVLGLELPAGLPPMEDGRRVLDLLAAHPGVARFVCTKLCRRLIADDPPQPVVDAATAVFLATTDAPDQLRRVVRTILLSDDFATSWGDKVRRPFELVTSAVRAMGPDFALPLGAEFSRFFYYLLSTTGNLPYTWAPPTGFPDRKEVWLTTNALVTSWRLVNLLAGLELEGRRPCDPAASTPAELTTAAEVADYWIERCLLRAIEPEARSKIVDFMAHDQALDAPLALADPRVADRLRSMVGLILMAPDFAWR